MTVDGDSCLHWAVEDGFNNSVRWLSAFDANVTLVDKDRLSAIDIAETAEIAALLVAGCVSPTDNRQNSLAVRNQRVVNARRDINHHKLDLIRRRATTICVALQNLQLPAFVMLKIVNSALCSLAHLVPLHLRWDLIVMVKHFNNIKQSQ